MTCSRTVQRGMALPVALIILLLVTLVSYTAMETSNMEGQMAVAKELQEISFQTAEVIVGEVMNDTVFMNDALIASLAGSSWPTKNHSYDDYKNAQRELIMSGVSEMRFITSTPAAGYSLRRGSGGVETLYYEASATASPANSGIEGTHIQGLLTEAPRIY